MTIMRIVLSIVMVLFCSLCKANKDEIDRLAVYMREAQILIETRSFLRELHDQHEKGTKINKKQALEVADQVEQIAIHGCECENLEQENMLGSQAYALSAGIYGILSKNDKNIKLGIKSYHGLVKARELDPANTDAIKGQAIALNMILSKSWAIRKVVAVALGINLEDARRELVHDLREFPERKDLQLLADKLEMNM